MGEGAFRKSISRDPETQLSEVSYYKTRLIRMSCLQGLNHACDCDAQKVKVSTLYKLMD